MSYPTASPATWLVTGTSRGFGLELVKQLLDRGDNVAATTRSRERLLGATPGADTTRLLPLEVDLRDATAVQAAVTEVATRFGDVDVVVNNAGYGFLGAVEETTDAEVRDMFEVQVYGTWNVLRSVLPRFRARRSGHVVNISSILGLVAVPGWGLYSSAKFAVEGLTEALAAEVAEYAVKVNLVEPGYFNTDFLTSNSLALPRETTPGYQSIRDMTQVHLDMPGSQPGDPVKGAAAIIDLVVSGDGPMRQLLGSDSYAYAKAKIQALTADVEAGKTVAHSTDYPR
ncbi:SDR family NAD(P)-dependent oxidoreductase [uncultured Friedmanniella sp.]|uniref:SDR family NAD(P)-dependent oxidoreductase n=1 Tax=uncultured Friedmanniella sp. TaxID=335381 RepID=UPI0035CC27D0